MKNISYTIILFLSFAFFYSCTEKIDLKLEGTGTLCAIYGEFTTDTMAHEIVITKSADYFSNKPFEPISGAIVSITDGTNTFNLTESPTELGTYLTDPDVYGVPGKTYTLNVSNVDLLGNGVFSNYTASSSIKPVGTLDSIKAEKNTDWDFWEIQVWAQEPGETRDFYMFKLHINDVLYTDSLHNYTITEDKFFNGSQTNGISVFYLPEKDTIKVGYKVTASICGINEDFFKFITEAQAMYYPQVPIFSGPPANLRTNISNNAVGYFAAYSVAKSTWVVKPKKKSN